LLLFVYVVKLFEEDFIERATREFSRPFKEFCGNLTIFNVFSIRMSSRGSRKSGKPSSKQQSSPESKKDVPTSPIASTSLLSNSSDSPDSKEAALSFPLVKINDNAKILPRYTSST